MGSLTMVVIKPLSVHCVTTEGYFTDDMIVVRIKRLTAGVTTQSLQFGPFKLNNGQVTSFLAAPELPLLVDSDPQVEAKDELQIELTDIDCPKNDCLLDSNDSLGTVTKAADAIAAEIGPGLFALGTSKFIFSQDGAHYIVHVQAEKLFKEFPAPTPATPALPPTKQIQLEIQSIQKEFARSAIFEVKKAWLSASRNGWPGTFSGDPKFPAPSQAAVVDMLGAEMLEHLDVDFAAASPPHAHTFLGARFLPTGCCSGLYREWIRRNVLGWAAAMGPLVVDGKFSAGQFVLGATQNSRDAPRKTADDFAKLIESFEDNGRDLLVYHPYAHWEPLPLFAADPATAKKAIQAVADPKIPVAQAQDSLMGAFKLDAGPMLHPSWLRMSWLETMFCRSVSDGLGFEPVDLTQGVTLDLRSLSRMLLQLFDRPPEALTVFAHQQFIEGVDAAVGIVWNTDLPGTLGWCVPFRDDQQLKPRMKALSIATPAGLSNFVGTVKQAVGDGSVFVAPSAARAIGKNAQFKIGLNGTAAESLRNTSALAMAVAGENAVDVVFDLSRVAVLPVNGVYHYNKGAGLLPGVADSGVQRQDVVLWAVRQFDVDLWNPLGDAKFDKKGYHERLPVVSSGVGTDLWLENILAGDAVIIVVS